VRKAKAVQWAALCRLLGPRPAALALEVLLAVLRWVAPALRVLSAVLRSVAVALGVLRSVAVALGVLSAGHRLAGLALAAQPVSRALARWQVSRAVPASESAARRVWAAVLVAAVLSMRAARSRALLASNVNARPAPRSSSVAFRISAAH
jgi:hypothetical protein